MRDAIVVRRKAHVKSIEGRFGQPTLIYQCHSALPSLTIDKNGQKLLPKSAGDCKLMSQYLCHSCQVPPFTGRSSFKKGEKA
jgi:hypothetical protein